MWPIKTEKQSNKKTVKDTKHGHIIHASNINCIYNDEKAILLTWLSKLFFLFKHHTTIGDKEKQNLMFNLCPFSV